MILRFESNQRGYMVELSEDLFGAYILRRRWYGLNNRRGGAKQQVFLNMSDALKEVRRITRTRERHGYRRQTALRGSDEKRIYRVVRLMLKQAR